MARAETVGRDTLCRLPCGISRRQPPSLGDLCRRRWRERLALPRRRAGGRVLGLTGAAKVRRALDQTVRKQPSRAIWRWACSTRQGGTFTFLSSLSLRSLLYRCCAVAAAAHGDRRQRLADGTSGVSSSTCLPIPAPTFLLQTWRLRRCSASGRGGTSSRHRYNPVLRRCAVSKPSPATAGRRLKPQCLAGAFSTGISPPQAKWAPSARPAAREHTHCLFGMKWLEE